jgi:Zn-dependent protease
MIFVAAAGPAMNLLLALLAAFLYHGVGLLPDGVAPWAAHNLVNAIELNVILAVFNMLPIPPLDGGRVAVGLLPDALAYPLARLESVGIFILLGLMVLPRMIDSSFDVFSLIVMAPAEAIIRLIVTFMGLV